jgi:AraC family transcriptional regulator of adaptative response / DNA-3-methyladenine glycosylase II
LLAKQLIHQTDLSMIQVALASGFGSVRRFNETFQRLYGRPPSDLRRRAAAASDSPEINILLSYRPPYDWASMVGFLRARAIEGVEAVTADSYRRVIAFDDAIGTIEVTQAPRQSALSVTVRFPRLNVLPAIIARVRRQFDLSAEPTAIAAALSCDPVLAPLVRARPGLRVPGAWDGFEIAVRAVLGQQITVKAATRLAGRLVAALGDSVDSKINVTGLTHAFPPPDRFEVDTLAGLGMPRLRAATLAAISGAAQRDARFFDPRRDLAEAVARLREVAGVGEWTAHYVAMRALGESDAFLPTDIGVLRTLASAGQRPKPAEVARRAEAWRPWRAYAMLHLWTADAALASPPEDVLLTKENSDALVA